MEIQIEKDIPLPKSKSIKYQEILESMEVGDSFLIVGIEINQQLRSLIQTASRVTNRGVTQRRDGKGLRIWRTS